MDTSVTVTQLGDGVWWSWPEDDLDRPVIGAIAGDDATLLVDAGNSPAHARSFLRALEEVGAPPVKYLVYTHSHWDHVWGASEIVARHKPVIVAHEQTGAKIREQSRLPWDDASLDARVERGEENATNRDKMKIELPSRTGLVFVPPQLLFTGSLRIDLGGRECVLDHVGGDHAGDSTIVCGGKVLFAGDAVYPSLAYATARQLTKTQILPLFDRLTSYDADICIFSHDPIPYPMAIAMGLGGIYARICQCAVDDRASEQRTFEIVQQEFAFPFTLNFVTNLVRAFRAGAGIPSSDAPVVSG